MSQQLQTIIDNAFEPSFGARPLKRYIQRKVETLVAKEIISKDIAPHTTIYIDVVNDDLAITNTQSNVNLNKD